ncbi:zinc-binding dehydrogenase [Sphingomonas naphthae]|uniref:Zinc-binding dehydrogenase n=1 Tax=Sphingomonas naphthae TaxID=1813468 RepID=A0ABY7TJW1_9SPHN|nr:zinc-binding dehydrogenase [Sphingomonas naphthae]WCT73061.1 zinc-binding dehydrogenase [Sphingomonas naphthae]
MRAVTVIGRPGGQRLAIETADRPVPMPGEALVAVEAISLNNGEVRTALAGAAGARPGWDFAGVIESAPAGSAFCAGDRVVGLKFDGAWAERVSVPTKFLAPIPDNVPFELAAVLPVAGLTATIALSKKALRAGDRLLVTAATGGVGLIAVQLAAATGAHVVAFARREDDAALLRRLGATAVAGSAEDAARLGPYDLILEGVGGELLGHALSWLSPRGMCVQFGDAGGDDVTTFNAKAFRLGSGGAFGGTSLYGFVLAEELTRLEPADAAALLAGLAVRLGTGKLDPVIGKIGSWREIDHVARALLSRAFKGKAVLRLD